MLESPSAICRLGYDHHLPAAPSPPSRQPSFSPPFPFSESPVRACLLGKLLYSLLPPSLLLFCCVPAQRCCCYYCCCPTIIHHHPPPSTTFSSQPHSLSPPSLSPSHSTCWRVDPWSCFHNTSTTTTQKRTSRCPLGSSCSLSCRAVYTSRTSSRMPFRTRDEQLAARYFLFPPPPPCSCCALLLSFLAHITCTRPAFEMI